MKTITGWMRVAALAGLVAPGLGRATTPADVAWITSAATVAGPLGLQAFTRSSLEVSIEVYRETITFPEGFDSNGYYRERSEGHSPFVLDGGVALRRRQPKGAAEDPVEMPTAENMHSAATNLARVQGQLQRSVDGLRAMVDKTKDWAEKDADPDSPVVQLWKEAQARQGAMENVLAAVVAFRSTVAEAMRGGIFTPAALETAANRLAAIRQATDRVPRDFSSVWTSYFVIKARDIMRSLAQKGTKEVNAPAPDLFAEELVPTIEARRENETQADAIQRHAWRYIEVIRRLEASRGTFVGANAKVREVPAQAIKDARASLAKRIHGMGFIGSEEELFASDRQSEFNLIWDRRFLDAILKAALNRACEATYIGVTVGANFGPIANEVFQGLLSPSIAIDEIATRPERWAPLNFVRSEGGAGTHNAVFYFDNMLTPIMKSASFDPTKLLLANAQIYRRATSVMADVFGAPAGDSTGANSVNLISIEARKRNAAEADTRKRQELLDALGLLLDERENLQTKFLNDAKDDWKDYNGAAKAQLEKLATRLSTRATMLDKP